MKKVYLKIWRIFIYILCIIGCFEGISSSLTQYLKYEKIVKLEAIIEFNENIPSIIFTFNERPFTTTTEQFLNVTNLNYNVTERNNLNQTCNLVDYIMEKRVLKIIFFRRLIINQNEDKCRFEIQSLQPYLSVNLEDSMNGLFPYLFGIQFLQPGLLKDINYQYKRIWWRSSHTFSVSHSVFTRNLLPKPYFDCLKLNNKIKVNSTNWKNLDELVSKSCQRSYYQLNLLKAIRKQKRLNDSNFLKTSINFYTTNDKFQIKYTAYPMIDFYDVVISLGNNINFWFGISFINVILTAELFKKKILYHENCKYTDFIEFNKQRHSTID